MWVEFMDMHSGGGRKWKTEYVFIEADDAIQAREVFERVTGRSPDWVSCETCGEDYSVSVADELSQHFRWGWPSEDRRKSATFIDRSGAEISCPLPPPPTTISEERTPR